MILIWKMTVKPILCLYLLILTGYKYIFGTYKAEIYTYDYIQLMLRNPCGLSEHRPVALHEPEALRDFVHLAVLRKRNRPCAKPPGVGNKCKEKGKADRYDNDKLKIEMILLFDRTIQI